MIDRRFLIGVFAILAFLTVGVLAFTWGVSR